ncbi:MAG: type II toxin-antitoxin system VapC family toxin [Planctomycetales bacterium]|nr:type II toxin-antitoxin system VapC family toxin [Planctomycetales bacterium]
MKYILDTDHVSELQFMESEVAQRLLAKLRPVFLEVAVTIISAEEQMRGWLAAIHAQKSARNQIRPYHQLSEFLQFYGKWIIVPWSEQSVSTFESLKHQKLKIGTMDLKIASIALATNAVLLTRNLADFQQVPGLIVEDWLS